MIELSTKFESVFRSIKVSGLYYCIICFYLYSSELVSLGSFVSKRLNLYFEQLY